MSLMSNVEVVRAGPSRAAISGLVLPGVPPARIYIGDLQYSLVAPRVPLPPIVNVIKFLLNWVGPGAHIAKNILFGQISGGTGSTSDPTFLLNSANAVLNAWNTANLNANISSVWSLQSVTAKDLGGTTAQAGSSAAALPGLSGAASNPPQTAVALSWQIAPAYRGGKPRTYLPGIPVTAQVGQGNSQISVAYADALQGAAAAFMFQFNGIIVSSTTFRFGNVSYFRGHAVRPTPIFNPILAVKVHERLDSQRRRSGKESTQGVAP